jgi:poly-gamma-glutamate capsule biosynthesis protein CapA/YwtB (metallophosphatase superfamily)
MGDREPDRQAGTPGAEGPGYDLPALPGLRKNTSRRTFLASAIGAGAAGIAATTGWRRYTSAALQSAPPVADGYALVTSPRVPLFGVGESEVAQILGGQIPDWEEVGSGVKMAVTPLALDGQVPEGARPAKTVADYEALIAEFANSPGGVAVVPLDQVDFRVNVLSVGGFDPLRDQDGDEPLLRIAFVGDIVPGRNVNAKMVQFGDYTHPFHKIARELSSYDLSIANLEGNLSASISPPTEIHTFSFVSDPAMLDGFKMAGIDAVTLANNHSAWNDEDWGVQGLLDTLDSLEAADMGRLGAGRSLDDARVPWTTEVAGKKIAILGFDGVTANEQARANDATVWQTEMGGAAYAGATTDSAGTNPYVTDQFLNDIAAAAETNDIVIPYFHLGVEYMGVPPDWGVEGARAAADAGATMVVTQHPHVIQGMENYNGKPIVYSCGNFIFDQMFSLEVRTGIILEIDIKAGKIVGLRPKGIEIEDFHVPRLMSAGEHAALMDRFWLSTDRIAAGERA